MLEINFTSVIKKRERERERERERGREREREREKRKKAGFDFPRNLYAHSHVTLYAPVI